MQFVVYTVHQCRKDPIMHPWKHEYYVLPDVDVNESIAMYLTGHVDVELKRSVMLLPGCTEDHDVYVLDRVLVEKLESHRSFKNKYKAFVRRTEGGKIYRHRSPAQIAKAKTRRAKKDRKKTRLNVSPSV